MLWGDRATSSQLLSKPELRFRLAVWRCVYLFSPVPDSMTGTHDYLLVASYTLRVYAGPGNGFGAGSGAEGQPGPYGHP